MIGCPRTRTVLNISNVMETKRQMRIYYRGVDRGLVPMIRISNVLLRKFDFEISDLVEIAYEPGKITITKIKSNKNYNEKQRR